MREHEDRLAHVGPAGERRAGRRRHRRARRQRGAVAVEYALATALVVVALIGSIEALGDSTSDELRDRGGAIGAPDLDATGDPAPPPPPTPDPTDPDPPEQPEAVVSVSLAAATTTTGNRWSASVTVTALDDRSQPHEAVLVEATWTSTSPSFSPQTTQCTTNVNGTCTMTIRNLNKNATPDVSLTITAVTGPGVVPGLLPDPLVVAP